MRDIGVLARQAAAQYGLLNIWQLREHFGSNTEVTSLVREGVLRSVRRGVYELTGSAPCWQRDVLAVCLASRRLVVASHRSALRLWGMRSVDDEVEVTIRYPSQLRIPGVVVHRSRDLSEHDVTFIDAIPVTSPARTLCDAGLVFPESEVERVVHQSLANDFLTVDDLRRYRERVGRQGRNGVGAIDAVLDRLPSDAGRAESGPEIALRQLCEQHGLPGLACQHSVVAQGRRYRLDFAYPERRIAIEYDGFEPHTRPEAFVADRQRQNDLVASGWRVLRFTWADLRDRPGTVALRISQAFGAHRT